MFFFFKHKTAYEMRISDWSSDGALPIFRRPPVLRGPHGRHRAHDGRRVRALPDVQVHRLHGLRHVPRHVRRTGDQARPRPSHTQPPPHPTPTRPGSNWKSIVSGKNVAVRFTSGCRPKHKKKTKIK